MDITSSGIPQLPVEVENIQNISNVFPSLEAEKETVKPNSENASQLEQSTKNKTTEILNPKFGSMETISLETSTHEVNVLHNQQSGDPNNSSNPNDLSKYFNVDTSSNQENADSKGISFFDALAQNTVKSKEENPFSMIGQKATLNEGEQNKSSLEVVSSENNLKIVEGECKDSGDPPPILLKFFSEEKSGTDKDGKAFFDKISEDKESTNFPSLEINELLKSPAATEYFLSSPATTTEIEEAWLPSEKTRQVLVSVVTSNRPVSAEKNDLTMPGVIIEEEMTDPVKALLIECNSPYAQQRKVLTANDVSEDEAGLQNLMENQCYHAAINLTKKLLASFGQGPGCDGKPSTHSPQSLKLWYTRLALLIKLRKFSLAEVESAAFGDLDKPDMYYEFYPDIYKGKKGTIVPFALRLLLAELPQYQGNHQVALDNMYHILNVIQKMILNVQNGCAEDGTMIELSDARKAASLEVWRKREKRVLFSILNCVLTQKDYIIAVSIMKMLIDKSEPDTAQLHSALGRIYLQLGDVQCAENCFKYAATVAEKNKQDFRVEENINNALLAIASDENDKAFKYFEQAYSLKPHALLVNNMAVCKLYTGHLKESLRLLESAIQKSPSSCLHDGLLFNVCTLYELESSRCPQKKLAMLELVSKYAGDYFNVNCLKIQTAKA